jgi:hypothetical protein
MVNACEECHRWLIVLRIFEGRWDTHQYSPPVALYKAPAASPSPPFSMSLLPISVVVVSFILLFRALGRKPEQDEDPPPFQYNHGLDMGRTSTAMDGLTLFQSIRNKPHPKPALSTPYKHHPCRVCGVPATKRCPRCKSVYYCSGDHTTWVSLDVLRCNSMYLMWHGNLKGLADAQATLFT